MSQALISAAISYVKATLAGTEAGHDWHHIARVYRTAMAIAQHEPQADLLVVQLAALLHDIADSKFHNGNETLGPQLAEAFMQEQQVAPEICAHVVAIIENMSFRKSLEGPQVFSSIELDIVRDADRLDAIGAIGIARTFNYGGYKNRPLYDPDIPPVTHTNAQGYKQSTAPTLNHFYEKLLLLKDQMRTAHGRALAQQRHTFMEQFLGQFYAEWEGER